MMKLQNEKKLLNMEHSKKNFQKQWNVKNFRLW